MIVFALLPISERFPLLGLPVLAIADLLATGRNGAATAAFSTDGDFLIAGTKRGALLRYDWK